MYLDEDIRKQFIPIVVLQDFSFHGLPLSESVWYSGFAISLTKAEFSEREFIILSYLKKITILLQSNKKEDQ